MDYLICDKCEGYYELQSGESPNDFDLSCDCGGELQFHNMSNDYASENNEPKREIIGIGKGYAEKKSSHYNNLFIFGGIIGLIGLIGIIITPFSLIILLSGCGLLYYGYNNGKSWNKGIIGESIVADYLNQLPEDYYIFNDVKFPGSYGNLDHIVIGPNGIFVIETKNYKGFYFVKDKEWFYKTGKYTKKARSQPGKQVIRNAISLRNFLVDNNIKMDGVWIDSIVTLLNNNFKIEKRPKDYNVLFPSTIPQFIQNSRGNIDINILNKAIVLIEPYCIELSYIYQQTGKELGE